MTLKIGWLHEAENSLGTWLHQADDWHAMVPRALVRHERVPASLFAKALVPNIRYWGPPSSAEEARAGYFVALSAVTRLRMPPRVSNIGY